MRSVISPYGRRTVSLFLRNNNRLCPYLHQTRLPMRTFIEHPQNTNESDSKTEEEDDDNKIKSDENTEEPSFLSKINQELLNVQKKLENKVESLQDNDYKSNHEMWKKEFEKRKNENIFTLKYTSLNNSWLAYLDYFHAKEISDRAFRFSMNGSLIQFSRRFLSYEELMVGMMNGFEFLIQSLFDESYADIQACVSAEVYHGIEKLRIAMLSNAMNVEKEEGNETIDECFAIDGYMPYLQGIHVRKQASNEPSKKFNLEEFRENPAKVAQMHELATLVPVEMHVKVRYYFRLGNDLQSEKYVDFAWFSKWNMVDGKYEVDDEGWLINSIGVTAVQ